MRERQSVAGFVLAGGKSSRMGEDKAFLEFAGRTLLEIALEKVREVAPVTKVVGPRNSFGSGAIEDVFPDCGPLAGIHTALTHSSSELNLILAVDTPFLEVPFLRLLIRQAKASQAVVTVPRTSDGYQPLCAVYRKDFLELAEEALKDGRYKIDALFRQTELRVVEEAELRRFAFAPAMFQNLNTRAEYRHAKARKHD
jgi:molybdopterin-guanine dinucleotide biosynthesis protein A